MLSPDGFDYLEDGLKLTRFFCCRWPSVLQAKEVGYDRSYVIFAFRITINDCS